MHTYCLQMILEKPFLLVVCCPFILSPQYNSCFFEEKFLFLLRHVQQIYVLLCKGNTFYFVPCSTLSFVPAFFFFRKQVGAGKWKEMEEDPEFDFEGMPANALKQKWRTLSQKRRN